MYGTFPLTLLDFPAALIYVFKQNYFTMRIYIYIRDRNLDQDYRAHIQMNLVDMDHVTGLYAVLCPCRVEVFMTLMKSKSGITLGLWHNSRQFCKNMYDLIVST